MKKYFYLFAMMLLSATVFTSCSDDDNNGSSKDLIGKWQSVSESGWIKEDGELIDEWDRVNEDDYLYVFTEDGEYLVYSYSGRRWVLETESEYKYKDGKLKVYYDGSYIGEFDVKKLTSETLVLAYREAGKEDGVYYEAYDELTLRKADDIEL